MKFLRTRLAVLAAAATVAACGGSGQDYTNLVAFGDSLTDVGTYNVGSIAAIGAQTGGAGRWTVNDKNGGQVWIERVADKLDMPKPCAAETGLSPNIPGFTGAPVTPQAGCSNWAQGSSRVSNPAGPNSVALQAMGLTTLGLTAKPVKDQMAAHLTRNGGTYGGRDIVMVMAGANDVFMELQLTAPTDPQKAVANMGAAGAELAALIKSQVMAKGAWRTMVFNIPYMNGTPFVQSLPPQTQGLVDTMVKTFNGELAKGIAGTKDVVLSDAYARGVDQATNPAKYGLTNTSDVACGPNALSSPATAPGSSLICNASNLLPGDRSKYLFADSVHPTPYGHKLMADFAIERLEQAGWN